MRGLLSRATCERPQGPRCTSGGLSCLGPRISRVRDQSDMLASAGSSYQAVERSLCRHRCVHALLLLPVVDLRPRLEHNMPHARVSSGLQMGARRRMPVLPVFRAHVSRRWIFLVTCQEQLGDRVGHGASRPPRHLVVSEWRMEVACGVERRGQGTQSRPHSAPPCLHPTVALWRAAGCRCGTTRPPSCVGFWGERALSAVVVPDEA